MQPQRYGMGLSGCSGPQTYGRYPPPTYGTAGGRLASQQLASARGQGNHWRTDPPQLAPHWWAQVTASMGCQNLHLHLGQHGRLVSGRHHAQRRCLQRVWTVSTEHGPSYKVVATPALPYQQIGLHGASYLGTYASPGSTKTAALQHQHKRKVVVGRPVVLAQPVCVPNVNRRREKGNKTRFRMGMTGCQDRNRHTSASRGVHRLDGVPFGVASKQGRTTFCAAAIFAKPYSQSAACSARRCLQRRVQSKTDAAHRQGAFDSGPPVRPAQTRTPDVSMPHKVQTRSNVD